MNLDELLTTIRLAHIFLRLDRGRVRWWYPNKRMSRETHQALRTHADSLKRLLEMCDVRVCPSADLHRKEWRYLGNGHFRCAVCERIVC